MDRKLIKLGALLELARREFFFYCYLKAPSFYKLERQYLVDFCNELQEFYESDEEVLVVNMPPRHGKSRTAGLLVEWVLGKNQTEKIMTGSYNENLSTTFSKNVRNSIQEAKADQYVAVFSDVFPNVRIKTGDGAMNLWSLEGGYNSYLATSPTGTATGFGCSFLIIDDLIKNSMEANNADVLEKHWDWFTRTMLARLEEGGKVLIIMTRWHSNDLAGRVLRHFTKEGQNLRHISYKALQDDGSMLCEDILSRRSYEAKARAMGLAAVMANYQQDPIDLKGRLYSHFKTYDHIPADAAGRPLFTAVKNYTDTADTGDDYLCAINYGVYNQEAYVLNVLYTKEAMEVTEPKLAAMLHGDRVNVADIESNNGGRGFGRQVERFLKERHHSTYTQINLFHQSKNKTARILSNSTWVMEHIYFPINWQDKWPEFFEAMNTYQREGKNAHDDAPDCVTGIAEKINQGSAFSFD
mgnify:CR=1 FL=1